MFCVICFEDCDCLFRRRDKEIYSKCADAAIEKERVQRHKNGKMNCHRVYVRYIIHLYCLAVQAGFYSDVVECSTIDRRVPGSILGRDMEIFLRVRDKWRPT